MSKEYHNTDNHRDIWLTSNELRQIALRIGNALWSRLVFDPVARVGDEQVGRAQVEPYHPRPPLLLLHSAEDLLEPAIQIEHQPTADKIRQVRFVAHGLYNDRDWNYMRDVLRWSLRTDMRPLAHSHDSWHFYRHSFAAWNLTGWEAVEATALAGQEAVTVRRKQLVFGTDPRPRIAPKFDEFPR